WQEIEGSFAVGDGGVGVEANGVEADVAEHVSDGDEVGAAPDEGSGEGMPPDVGGDVLFIEVGFGGDAADDVAGARTDSRRPRRLSSNAGLAPAPGQSGRSSSQACRSVRSWACIGRSRGLPSLPRTRRVPLRADRRTSSTS